MRAGTSLGVSSSSCSSSSSGPFHYRGRYVCPPRLIPRLPNCTRATSSAFATPSSCGFDVDRTSTTRRPVSDKRCPVLSRAARTTRCTTRATRFFATVEYPKQSEVDPRVRYPKQYLDVHAFKRRLTEKKQELSRAEVSAVRREYAKPPPEGWDVRRFLKAIPDLFKEDENQLEEVAALFDPPHGSWADFASMDQKEVMRIPGLTGAQRRKLIHFLTEFNHGMFPKEVYSENQLSVFAGRKYAKEGLPWTDEMDDALKASCDYWDVNFGDPWIYISNHCERPAREVKERWLEIVKKPQQRRQRCELTLSDSMKPLLMNRHFRMLPPTLFLVPSKKNFPLARLPKSLVGDEVTAGIKAGRETGRGDEEEASTFDMDKLLPKNLRSYRDGNNFGDGKKITSEAVHE
ncbi:unnamed protein product [Amoebophrya sp. A120]|nr:unnamed protein product [Amoebophrya sp. A120]|eukprot:GSA120T00018814001.1